MDSVVRETVTAVVICHDRDVSYLSTTLAALAQQTHQPDHILVHIPSHSSPAVAHIHSQLPVAAPNVSIVAQPAETLGAALHDLEIPESQWIWILHADSAPEPSALDALLRAGESSNRIGIVGPKQISWEDRDGAPVLYEVGIRATRSARRVPEVEPDERDQGQHDSRTDVLAVGSAGMLVRRSAWDELGGFNEYLGPFGEGLEFSRRARRSGYRVVVEPQAVLRHARVSLGTNPEHSFGRRRAAQLFTAMLSVRAILLPLLVIGYPLVGIARALVRLICKEPVLAFGELRAGFSVPARLGAILRSRRQIARTAMHGIDVVRPLEARASDIRAARRESRRSRKEARWLAQAPDPLTRKLAADLARHTRHGFALVLVVTSLFSLVFFLRFFSSGVLIGGALTADTATGTDLISLAWHGWMPSGDGYSRPLDALWLLLSPFLLITSPWSVTLGSLITALVYIAPICAGANAYIFAGRLTKSWVARTALSLIWVVSPAFTDALSNGIIGAVLVHVLVPLWGYALCRMWDGSIVFTAVAALSFAVLTASAPIFLPLGILVVVCALACKPRHKSYWPWSVLLGVLVLLPQLLQVRNPVAFFFSQPGRAFGSDSLQNLARAAHTSPLLLAGLTIFAVVSILALLRLHRMWLIRIGWLIIAAGMALGSLAARTTVAMSEGVSQHNVNGDAHIGYTLAWWGMVIALGAGSHSLLTTLRNRSFGLAHIISGVAMMAIPIAIITTAVATTTWHVDHSSLGRQAPQVPALSREIYAQHQRILVVENTSAGIYAQEWSGSGKELHEYSMVDTLDRYDAAKAAHNSSSSLPAPTSGETAGKANSGKTDPALTPNTDVDNPASAHVSSQSTSDHFGQSGDDSAQRDLQDAILAMLAGSADASEKLADHAIAMVLVPPASAQSSAQLRADLVSTLHAVSGLEFISDGAAGTFWRVSAPSALVRIGEQPVAMTGRSYDASSVSPIKAAAGERTIRLAQRADSHWQAYIDGQSLEPRSAAWAQEWIIPPGISGTLDIVYVNWQQRLLVGAIALCAAINLIIAMPIRRRRGGIE
ncbi:glycosyltransferase family 2 protein [Trueperella sp. LYQ141]|uniref:glycosyltransferase family 2 protein n=1 Tax=Trueperella sp. LYQ141 TaxID=3391058 RepID=UPI003982ECEC